MDKSGVADRLLVDDYLDLPDAKILVTVLSRSRLDSVNHPSFYHKFPILLDRAAVHLPSVTTCFRDDARVASNADNRLVIAPVFDT